jgi:hypothetical protein
MAESIGVPFGTDSAMTDVGITDLMRRIKAA